jgi:hypothetical protein
VTDLKTNRLQTLDEQLLADCCSERGSDRSDILFVRHPLECPSYDLSPDHVSLLLAPFTPDDADACYSHAHES